MALIPAQPHEQIALPRPLPRLKQPDQVLHVVQARHGYAYGDIEWDASFAPCVQRKGGGGIHIDFCRFHETVPLHRLE